MSKHFFIDGRGVTISMLGTMPDWQLAKILGVRECTVTRNRKRLGIAEYDGPIIKRHRKRKTRVALASKAADASIVDTNYGTVRRCIGGNRHLLGVVSDEEIADLCACTRGTVGTIRRMLGIKAFVHPNNIAPKRWYDHLIGTMPDMALGRMVGISGVRIGQLRKARGIPKFQKVGGENLFEKNEKTC